MELSAFVRFVCFPFVLSMFLIMFICICHAFPLSPWLCIFCGTAAVGGVLFFFVSFVRLPSAPAICATAYPAAAEVLVSTPLYVADATVRGGAA